ncbi:MAG: rRNA pseudouridine synthase, partial [Methylocystis sp.]|nr:rRNA pseudouridine synthase [Methylocystis sp.]
MACSVASAALSPLRFHLLSERMSNEKPRRPGSRSTGGDRPLHRRDAKPYQARDRRRDDCVDDKPGTRKPRAETPHPAPSRAPKAFEGERVAKVMARAGLCSRRDAEQWIAQGRVAVNGRVLMSPAVNVRAGDQVTVDGKPLVERERTRLFLFHKPAGLVTSAKDRQGRATVFDYLQKRHPDLPRVVSVGRLDINSEGLLLLTNDGGLARTLELPATGWARRYRVRAHGSVDQAALDALKKGVTIDGVAYAPIEASLDRLQGANAWISMSLREGKNREIKRVLEHLGLEVARLIRVSFGPFQLGEMGEGDVAEVRLKVLREQLGKGLAELAGVDFSSPLQERGEQTPGEAQEARERAQKRTRKHVSVLRTQHDESRDKSPRSRIERGATADHKGRAVAVEKIVAARPQAEPMTRNARRFRAERQAVE